MKLGFDAKRALNNGTGLGNHARILLNAMMRDFPDHSYLLYTPKAKDQFLSELHGDFQLHFPTTKVAQSLNSWWRSYGMTGDVLTQRTDIYHGLSNELPLNIHRTGIATVVTIHDLIFLKHKEQYPLIDRQIYTYKTKYAARHADRIIAVSEETKRDLIELYKVPERKIRVIYPSIDVRFYEKASTAKKAEVAKQYQLPAKFILNVGSFFPRKNQMQLIAAFDKIKNNVEEDLALIGTSGNMLNTIRQEILSRKLQDRVHIITSVKNDDLPAVYQLASLFVFPSLFEGFGAPVLEALFSQVPVIASAGGAIEEAAGKNSLLIDPTEIDDIAAKMVSALTDEAVRNNIVAKGLEHALTMTDAIFAARTIDVYEGINPGR
jgi:glycosyltransferase involved in cell wall biosynthesis